MARLDLKENASDDTNHPVELEESQDTYSTDTEVQFDEAERELCIGIGSETDTECDADPYDEISDCDSETCDSDIPYTILQIPAMNIPNREEDSLITLKIPQPNYPESVTKKGNIPTIVSWDLIEIDICIDKPQTFEEWKLPMPHEVSGYEQYSRQEEIQSDSTTVAEKLQEQSEDETCITLDTVEEKDSDNKEKGVNEAEIKGELQAAIDFVDSKVTLDEGYDEHYLIGLDINKVLDDAHDIDIQTMNFVARLLKRKFGCNVGMLLPGFLYERASFEGTAQISEVGRGTNAVQIHYLQNHFVVSAQFNGRIYVYDSLDNKKHLENVVSQLKPQLNLLYENTESIQLVVLQSQGTSKLCGCFAAANAYKLLELLQNNSIPAQTMYKISQMRQHLYSCLDSKLMQQFPEETHYQTAGKGEKRRDLDTEPAGRLMNKDKVPGWDITTFVTHGNFQSYPKHKMMSKIRSDGKLASRIMNFSIVPLLVAQEYAWNIPYLGRGLHVLGTRRIDERNMDDPIRILYQMTSALQFVEKFNPVFRETVCVHLDLKSRNVNIILDYNQNAGLIDFGLAREINETDTSLNLPEPKVPKFYFDWSMVDSSFPCSEFLHFVPEPVENSSLKNGFSKLVGEFDVGANVLKAGHSELVDGLVAGKEFLIQLNRKEESLSLLRECVYLFRDQHEWNELVVHVVMSGGEKTYEQFKCFLKQTNQDTLLQYLTQLEDRFYRKRYDKYLKKTTDDSTFIKRTLTEVQNTWVRFEGEPLTEVQQTLKGRQLALLSTGRLQNYGDSGDNPGLQAVQKGQLRREEVTSCPKTSVICVLITLLISCLISPCSSTSKIPVKRNTFRTIIFLSLLCFSQAGYAWYPGQNDGDNSRHLVEPFDGALVHISKAWDLVEEIKGERNGISELDIFNELVDYDELLFGEFRDGWLPFKIQGEMHIKQYDNANEGFEVQCGGENILLEKFTKLGFDVGQTYWTEIRVCISDPLQNTTKYQRTNTKNVFPENAHLQCFTQIMDLPIMQRCKDETTCFLNCTHSKKSFTGVFEITKLYEELFTELIFFVLTVMTATLFFCCMIYEQSYVAPVSASGGAGVILLCVMITIYVIVWITLRVKKENTDTCDQVVVGDNRLHSDAWKMLLFLIGRNFCGYTGHDVNVTQTFRVIADNTSIKFTNDSNLYSNDSSLYFVSGILLDDWKQNVLNEGCRSCTDQQKGLNISIFGGENELAQESGSDECESEPSQTVLGVGLLCVPVKVLLLLCTMYAGIRKYFFVKSTSSIAIQETCDNVLDVTLQSEHGEAERSEHHSSCHSCEAEKVSHSEKTENEWDDYICLQGKGKNITHKDIEKERHFQQTEHYTAEVYKSEDTVPSDFEPLEAAAADDVYIHDSVATKAYMPSKDEEIIFENAIENATDVDFGSFEEEETQQKKYENDSRHDDFMRQNNRERLRTKHGNGETGDDFVGCDDENETIDVGSARFEENKYITDVDFVEFENETAAVDFVRFEENEDNTDVDFGGFENGTTAVDLDRFEENKDYTDVDFGGFKNETIGVEFEEKRENCSDQDDFIKQGIRDDTDVTHINILAHSNSEAKQIKFNIDKGAQDRNSHYPSRSKRKGSYEAKTSDTFYMAEIENSNGNDDLNVTIPPPFGSSLPLAENDEIPEKSKLRLKVIPSPSQKIRQQSAVEAVAKKVAHLSCKRQQSFKAFKNLKFKVEVERSRKENTDCTFTEDEFETLLAIRACTWLPLNELPVPEIKITVAFVPKFEPLLSIIEQIANGTPPTPHVSMRYELLRFCTLRSYPKENKPYLIKLAEAGFYYASDGDGVVCYCCGVRRYNWVAEDMPMKIHERINPNCKFLRKNEEVNVPVQYFGPFSRALMAIMDIPEPRERSEQSEDVNNDWAPERIRSPAPAQQNQQVETGANSLGINTAIPKHTQYATKTAREGSYSGWPDTASHTPQELAEAGFFYAGFGDCVRCFYCGIGLRHWTKDDNPWIEHARWSRNCVFVKQKKGEEFVNLVQLAVQYSQDNEAQSNSSAGNQLPVQEIERILLSDAAQSVLEMGYQPRIIKKAIEQILRQDRNAKITAQILMEKVLEIEEAENPPQAAPAPTQEPVAAAAAPPQAKPTSQPAKTEGATNKEGSQAAAKPKAEKKPDEGAKSSLQSKDSDKDKDKKETKTNSESKDLSTEAISQDPKAIKAENEQLKEQTLCKVCLDNTVCIVFLPCGHLVTCADCAPAMRKCPICRALVKGTVRTYMS
ncbi:uncharacterized protein LOC123552200 isoform X2 [Mercenaria mercenaria]|uniref:uncharacterized protein LOC123552200 isoform X2 n=1 Tax=Mercenaria mercenaria TaxID=6596 RepID=UPI00234F084A|nr:uncharacterized protein LOC123552200 isoform X2 [Mercenaria mercenaria]